MKKILFIIAAALMVIGCQQKNAKVDVKAESERLFANLEAAYDPELTTDELGYMVEQTMDSVYMLLKANMGAPYSDSLFLDVYNYLTVEQQDELMAVMPEEMKQSEVMAPLFKALQAKNATAPGKPYIDFTALTPNGEEISLSDLVGKTDYVLVDFWASWCGPCRRSMPGLKELLAAHGDKLAILGVSRDENEDSWLQAVEALELPWSQLRDVNNEGARTYGIMFIPSTVLINRDGTILARNPSHAEIESLIQ